MREKETKNKTKTKEKGKVKTYEEKIQGKKAEEKEEATNKNKTNKLPVTKSYQKASKLPFRAHLLYLSLSTD